MRVSTSGITGSNGSAKSAIPPDTGHVPGTVTNVGPGRPVEYRGATISLLDGSRVLVESDLIGSFPVYYRADERGTVLTSDLRPFLPATLDRPALACSLIGGHPLGGSTLFDGWKLIPPASRTTVGPRGVIDARAWWEPPARTSSPGAEVARAASRLLEVVESIGRPTVVSLTGGLDSRALLALTLRGGTQGLTVFTHGGLYSGDQRVAGSIARKLGVPHRRLVIDPHFRNGIKEDLTTLCRLSDGMTSAHWVHGVGSARIIRDAGVHQTGAGAEIARGFFYYRGGSTRPLEVLRRRLSAPEVTEAVDRLLDADRGDAVATYLGQADRAFSQWSGLDARTQLDMFFLFERVRYMTAASSQVGDRSGVDAAFPYLDPAFVTSVLSLPPSWRASAAVHSYIADHYSPGWLRRRRTDRCQSQFPGTALARVVDRYASGILRRYVRRYADHRPYLNWILEEADLRARLEGMVEERGLNVDGARTLFRLVDLGVPSARVPVGNLVGMLVALDAPSSSLQLGCPASEGEPSANG